MKQNNTHKPAASPHITEQNLELVAADLDHHAKSKIPEGCLNGILTGYEPDIRQQAVLMALRWWIDHHTSDFPHDWNPRRSVSHALHFTKLQYLEEIERLRESTYHDERDIKSVSHWCSMPIFRSFGQFHAFQSILG